VPCKVCVNSLYGNLHRKRAFNSLAYPSSERREYVLLFVVQVRQHNLQGKVVIVSISLNEVIIFL